MDKNIRLKIRLYLNIVSSYILIALFAIIELKGLALGLVLTLLVVQIIISAYLSFVPFKNKYPLGLKLMHVFTLYVLYPFEMIWYGIKRMKYNRLTPGYIKSLTNVGLKFHIVFGTFLFYYRNNNFKDDDMDIAVYHQDYKDPKKVIEIAKKAGFTLRESGVGKGKVAEYSFTNKDKAQLDIYFFDKEDPRQRTGDEKNNRYARKINKYKYEIKEYKYKDITFMAPSEPEKYLTWEYGVGNKTDPTYNGFYGGQGAKRKIIEGVEHLEYRKY